MKFLLVLACLIVAALANSADTQRARTMFNDFEIKYQKTYKNAEERNMRYGIFLQNLEMIEEHNRSGRSWTMAVNQFADMTQDEFKSERLGYINVMQEDGPAKEAHDVDLKQLPDSVDWRTADVVTPAKDQGSCGSCWAFATVEMIESYGALNGGPLLELSPQHITSCTPNSLECGGTGGCAGSIPQLGFMYTQLFGLTLDADWPYTATDGECTYNPPEDKAHATVMGYEVLKRNDYGTVAQHLADTGPLSVAVDASAWSFYSGGVFDGCDFNSNIDINHAVQLVGYGSDNGEDYWIVRNSWGLGWGTEDGYIWLKRQTTPECGTDSTPLHGTACVNDGNDEQHVCGQCGVLFDVVYPIGASTWDE